MSTAAHLRTRPWARAVALAVLGAACAVPAAAQDGRDTPEATIPLEPLGYQTPPSLILLTKGFAVASLHYVDAHHLLFTYNARTLIKRLPEDSADDNPQNVNAVLMEVPSGKVLARTQWRLHDHGQYLWQVGEGTYLLRLGRELRLLTPLVGSDPVEGLRGKLLLTLPGQANMIEVSPDGRMVLVEADIAVHPAVAEPAVPVQSPIGTPTGSTKPAVPEDHTTDVQFLEFDLAGQATGAIHVTRVAHLTAPDVLGIPLVHDGYVDAKEIYPDDWDLLFVRLGGSSTVLGDVVSTCHPRVAFLSNREMLVETCNGNDAALVMTVVTLDKKELWQRPLDTAGTEPSLHTTPAAGRFAVSRILTQGAEGGISLLTQDNVRMQRIDVMDIQNGALVASVAAAPPESASQNFSLSTDGRHLAVLQNDVIALYDLGPLQNLPAAKIKMKDYIFVAATDGAPAPPPGKAAVPVVAEVTPVAVAAAPAPAAEASAATTTVIEAPLNVDERRTPPTLFTPEEQRSVEGKKNKQITLPPPEVPPDPKKSKE